MREACDPRRQKYLATYFATDVRKPGSDALFPGLTAVRARSVAVRFADQFRRPALRVLLASAVNEHRFVALEMLVRQYETGGPVERERIASFYIRNLRYVDHWVLVDTSAPYILGDHLMKRRRTLLFELASSRQVAKRRTAIVATWAFIRVHDFADTLRIAELLLHDEHELIHRAVGWMLREVGKRSPAVAERFLREHHPVMPRLMLRYAVEWLPEARRRRYL
jgi:3-methyladenine DNA glycosylase AlkD